MKESQYCERCGGPFDNEHDNEACRADYERHLRWLEHGDGPTGAWNQKLVLCSKCEWPLILHGPECENLT